MPRKYYQGYLTARDSDMISFIVYLQICADLKSAFAKFTSGYVAAGSPDKLPAVITSSIICKFVCANVPSGAVAAVPAVFGFHCCQL